MAGCLNDEKGIVFVFKGWASRVLMSNIDAEYHLSLTSHCQGYSCLIRAENRAGLYSTSVMKTQYGRTMCSCALISYSFHHSCM